MSSQQRLALHRRHPGPVALRELGPRRLVRGPRDRGPHDLALAARTGQTRSGRRETAPPFRRPAPPTISSGPAPSRRIDTSRPAHEQVGIGFRELQVAQHQVAVAGRADQEHLAADRPEPLLHPAARDLQRDPRRRPARYAAEAGCAGRGGESGRPWQAAPRASRRARTATARSCLLQEFIGRGAEAE